MQFTVKTFFTDRNSCRFLVVGLLGVALSIGGGGDVFAQQAGGAAGGGGSDLGNTGGETGGDFRTADQAFADGVQRAGAPEARELGTGGAEVANAQGNGGGGLFGGGGLGGGFGGLGGFSQLFGGFGQGQQQTKTVRTRLASGISVQPVAPRVVAATVNTRLSTLASRSRFDKVRVELTGRTAVLNGQVDSDADRRMAVLLVRLEPGVSKVEDRLAVAE